MPKKSIWVATANSKAIEFISNYFQATESLVTVIRSKDNLERLRACQADLIFFEAGWLGEDKAAELDWMKNQDRKGKWVSLGRIVENGFSWDERLDFPVQEKEFRIVLFRLLPFPDPVKLLAVDDEPSVLEVIQDYFGVRKDPVFQVRTAGNGLEAFRLIGHERPHCMILDLKMPVRTGTELYRDVRRAGLEFPTIIYIDATTADDVSEIKRWGRPVFVEKSGSQSSMQELLHLVKKLVLFG